jgi:hypothetical protein
MSPTAGMKSGMKGVSLYSRLLMIYLDEDVDVSNSWYEVGNEVSQLVVETTKNVP